MIWLTQFLCPSRHCAFGAVWDDETQSRDEIERDLRAQTRAAGLVEECGICGAAVTPEHRALPGMTMEQALPIAKELQQANLASRALLDAFGLTRDSQRARRRDTEN